MKRGLLIGVSVIAIFSWPLAMQARRLRAAVPKEAARLARMQQQAQDVLKLRADGVSSDSVDATSLSGIETSADQAGLRSNVSGVAQTGTDGITVTLQRAPFSRVVWWINELRSRRGIRVERASFQLAEPGLIDAQVQLR